MSWTMLIVVVATLIAGLLASIFLRRGRFEQAAKVFFSTLLAPAFAWMIAGWIEDEAIKGIYDRFYIRTPGQFYGVLQPPYDLFAEFLHNLAGAAALGTFIWLCIYWARQAEHPSPAPKSEESSAPRT